MENYYKKRKEKAIFAKLTNISYITSKKRSLDGFFLIVKKVR